MTTRGDQIAVISDVHGNSLALRAVLDDIESRGIERILNLGDCVYGPLDPDGAADMLISRRVMSVMGNEDRLLLEAPANDGLGSGDIDSGKGNPSLTFTLSRLAGTQVVWISLLQPELHLEPDLYLCHGAPGDDTEYLLWTIDDSGARRSSSEAILSRLAGAEASVILCGHDHIQFDLRLPDGRLVLDPGSVGLPAYKDSHPYPHVMQSGTPHARYSILRRDGGDWKIEHYSVAYDWAAASRMAAKNGRTDWAKWLLTGSADFTIL